MIKLTTKGLQYLLFCLLFIGQAIAEQDKGFLWEVRSATARVYLMGSIHFASADIYPLRRKIETAFAESDQLVVEADISTLEPSMMQTLLLSKGVYQDGSTIKDHISAETFALLERYLQQRGLPVSSFTACKPGMLVMTLASIELIRAGLSPNHGLDLHFLNQAKGNKPVGELESLEQQLDLIINMGPGDQMLRQTLLEFDDYPTLISEVIRTWKAGDADELNELLLQKPLREYPESKPVVEKLFYQRNREMTAKIRTYLASDESYFVVVGAGHLIGEQGIIALLRQAGFNPQQR